jgi:hypothetical protein
MPKPKTSKIQLSATIDEQVFLVLKHRARLDHQTLSAYLNGTLYRLFKPVITEEAKP